MESEHYADPLDNPKLSEDERKRLLRAKKFGIDLAAVQETIEEEVWCILNYEFSDEGEVLHSGTAAGRRAIREALDRRGART